MGNRYHLIVHESELKDTGKTIEQCIKSLFDVDKYAYILHNKDVRPHYHVYLEKLYPSDIFVLAEIFEIYAYDVSILKCSTKRVLEYFLGKLQGQEQEHKYSKKDIISNFDVRKVLKSKE